MGAKPEPIIEIVPNLLDLLNQDNKEIQTSVCQFLSDSEVRSLRRTCQFLYAHMKDPVIIPNTSKPDTKTLLVSDPQLDLNIFSN